MKLCEVVCFVIESKGVVGFNFKSSIKVQEFSIFGEVGDVEL